MDPTEALIAPPPLPDAAPPSMANDWQAPPARAVRLYGATTALALGLLALFPAWIFAMAADDISWPLRIGLCAGGVLLLAALGWFLGTRLRHQRWKLDATGLWLRKGRAWMTETRMPASRVQHLDVKHGPLERRQQLATLVLHTAGTRLTAVTVRGLEDADAQRLRDALSRQVDDEH